MASAFCKHCATAIRAAARAVSSCAQERHATGLVPALRVLLSLRSNACVSVPVRSNLHGRITKAFNAAGKNVLNMAIFRKKLIFFRWLPHYPFTCSIFSHGDQWASAFCKHCATASEAAARAVSSWLENQWPPKPSRFSAKSQDSGTWANICHVSHVPGALPVGSVIFSVVSWAEPSSNSLCQSPSNSLLFVLLASATTLVSLYPAATSTLQSRHKDSGII